MLGLKLNHVSKSGHMCILPDVEFAYFSHRNVLEILFHKSLNINIIIYENSVANYASDRIAI